MRILFCDMGSFTYKDIVEEFERRDFSVKTFYYSFDNKYTDEFYEERLEYELTSEKYDMVFSVNFYPVIASVCSNCNMVYVSWSYDAPLEEGLEEYFNCGNNYIFLFDRAEREKYIKSGHKNVYHLPLAVNCDRIRRVKIAEEERRLYATEISFIGSLYQANLDTVLYYSNDYIKGYVESLFQTQLNLFGVNIIPGAISDELIKKINDANHSAGQTKVKINRTGLAFSINSAITNAERTFLLNELSRYHKVSYYGFDKALLDVEVECHGPVKYYTDMNKVFMCSSINLCPTLRSITSGIPLRALDILGAGGTLMSNYQPELSEFFVDGQDVIMYGSFEDAFEKAEYYLANDEVRQKISISGRKKVEKFFTYKERFDTMLEVISL